MARNLLISEKFSQNDAEQWGQPNRKQFGDFAKAVFSITFCGFAELVAIHVCVRLPGRYAKEKEMKQ